MNYEDENGMCTHPLHERRYIRYPDAGYLNVAPGWRDVCTGCGTDFGPKKMSSDAVARLMKVVQSLYDATPQDARSTREWYIAVGLVNHAAAALRGAAQLLMEDEE